MKRYCDMKDISDGNLYEREDMVLADCQGCVNCHKCCEGMGDSIILDPMDVYRLTKACKCSLDELLQEHLALTMADNVILPHLKMSEKTGCCSFLNEEGRCSIHGDRPGICRLFPLGRIYEDGTFSYFLQIHECANEHRSEVKVSDWLNTENLEIYEKYISDWHYFLKDWQKKIGEKSSDETLVKQMVMYILLQFFKKAYVLTEDFYPQFYQRLEEAKELLKEL